MKYTLTLLALTLATFTSAIPLPQDGSTNAKRANVNGASYIHSGGSSSGGDHHDDDGDWHKWGGSPHENWGRSSYERRSSPAPGDSWGQGSGGKYDGQGLDARGPPPGPSWGGHGGGGHDGEHQDNGGQQQGQHPGWDYTSAQQEDDAQDAMKWPNLPNSASPPPDDTTWATTKLKERRGSPAPGDSWGQGSGGKYNGQGLGAGKEGWGP